MIKRLAAWLAALALGLSGVLAVSTPVQAFTCDSSYAPAVSHGLVLDNYGNVDDMAWTGQIKKDPDHNSDCSGIKVWGFIRSGCLYPQDGYTLMRVRLTLASGATSVGSLFQVYCGSSAQVVLTPSQPDGQWFSVEATYPLGNWAYNVRVVT